MVQVPSAYNAILGRSGLNAFQAIVSTYHLLMKFSTSNGIGEARANQTMARQCYSASLQAISQETLYVELLDTLDEAKIVSMKTTNKLIQIPLSLELLDLTVKVSLELAGSIELCVVLWCNADVFAWSTVDMPGIPTEVITHHLQANPSVKPVK